MGPQSGTGVNRDVNFLVPAVIIAAAYAFLMLALLDPGSNEVAQKTRQLESLEKSGPTPVRLAKLAADERKFKDERRRAEMLLADVRREARQVSGQNNDPVAPLGLLSVVNDIFEQHGLTITDDHSADGSSRPRLAGSLDEATARLEALIDKSRPQSSQPNLPPEVLAEMFGTRGSSGRSNRKLLLREMQVVGGYAQMIQALDDLASDAGDSVVLGLGLERKGPADRRLLMWTVTLHVQPSPDRVVVQEEPLVSLPGIRPADRPRPASVVAASRRQ